MAQNSVVCDGCMSQFSQSGFAFHIRQTTNPLCQQIYHAQLGYIPESDPPDPDSPQDCHQYQEMSSPSHDNPLGEDLGDLDHESVELDQQNPEILDAAGQGSDIWPMEFDLGAEDGEGDDENAGASPHSSEDEDEEDRDDEDAAEQYELELQWEPAVEDALLPQHELTPPQHVTPVMPEETPAPVAGAANALEPPCSARNEAEQSLKDSNIRVTAFPSQNAGVPVQTSNTYHTYGQHQANSGNQSNPYSPFASKLDWEFAYWAKQYGPGSNAITKLLQIDGVCSVFTDKF
jgi:hypothetical protein